MPSARHDELTLPVDELIAHRLHLHVSDRIAELIGDASGDGAAARQAEIDFVEHLAGCDVERLARLEWPRLSVFEGHDIRPCSRTGDNARPAARPARNARRCRS